MDDYTPVLTQSPPVEGSIKEIPPCRVVRKRKGVVGFLSMPVCGLVNFIHRFISKPTPEQLTRMHPIKRGIVHIMICDKKCHTTIIGLGVMYVGSFMAIHPIFLFDRALWDMAAWGVHGLGAAPVVKSLAEKARWEI